MLTQIKCLITPRAESGIISINSYRKDNISFFENFENYRPASISNFFSKVYEKFLLEKFKPFINSFLSEYMAAYRNKYSTNHVLLRLIGNWKKALDEKFLVGTVLTDLSKAFDCIPHNLLVAKLHAYGFSQKTVTFIYSYIKRRKEKE